MIDQFVCQRIGITAGNYLKQDKLQNLVLAESIQPYLIKPLS